MSENEKLQNHVIQLLATIAVYQPSLLEIFIDLEDDKESALWIINYDSDKIPTMCKVL